MDHFDVFKNMERPAYKPEPGFFIDFLGVRTRVSYFVESIHYLSGTVWGIPKKNDLLFFEYEEWQGVMDALRGAADTFSCIELGCGWGPWLVATAAAAKMLGIDRIQLIGVEAELNEISNLQTHFSDNGLDCAQHHIIHAAIDDHNAPASPSNPGGAPLMDLNSLLSGVGIIDLIHCDIQFAESRAFRSGIDSVTAKVKRVVVGTHSRKIEDELIEIFSTAGWILDYESPCKYHVINKKIYLLADGAQVWRNGRLTDLSPDQIDPAWYLNRYPDVAAAGLDAEEHYRLYGRAEGRFPNADAESSS